MIWVLSSFRARILLSPLSAWLQLYRPLKVLEDTGSFPPQGLHASYFLSPKHSLLPHPSQLLCFASPPPPATAHPFQAPHLAVSFPPLRSLLQYHLLQEALLDYSTSVGNSLSSTATSVSFPALRTKLRLHLALLIYYLVPLLVLSSMTVRNLSTLFTSVN